VALLFLDVALSFGDVSFFFVGVVCVCLVGSTGVLSKSSDGVFDASNSFFHSFSYFRMQCTLGRRKL
jgi:hypothetical protein